VTTLLIAALLVSGPDPSPDDLPADVFARPPGTVDAAFERFLAIVGKDEHTSTARPHPSKIRATGIRNPGRAGSPGSSCRALKVSGSWPGRWTVTVWKSGSTTQTTLPASR
jgi:hypothetical protein